MKYSGKLILSLGMLSLCSCNPLAQEKNMEVKEDAMLVDEKTSQVLFLANYMDSFNPINPKAAEQDLGIDVYPFYRRMETEFKTREAEVEAMLRYGFDGMQVWPNYRRAELWLDAVSNMKIEKPFYVTPQIAGIADRFFKSYEDFVAQTADFLKKHRDHPNLLKINGLPVISTWGQVSGYLDDTEKFREDVRKASGREFFLLPTFELGVHDPNMERLKSLGAMTNDSFNAWRNLRDGDQIKMISDALISEKRSPLIVGSMWTGFCSNNRMFNDSYRPYFGAGELIHSLNAGVDAELNIMIMPTWNDVHESAAFPSWKNIYGTSEITRFYRDVYEFGHSKSETTQLVVTYLQDILLGDSWNFGVVILPGIGADGEDFNAVLELQDVFGKTVVKEQISLRIEGNDRAQTEDFLIKLPDMSVPVFSPVLTYDGVTKRLPPVIIRHGRSRTTSPTLVSWRWLGDAEVKLQNDTPVIIEQGALSWGVQVKSETPIDEVIISDISDVLFDLANVSDSEEVSFTIAIDNLTGKNTSLNIEFLDGLITKVHQRGAWEDGDFAEEKDSQIKIVQLRIPASTRGYRPDSPVIVISGKAKEVSSKMKITHEGEELTVRLGDLAVQPIKFSHGEGQIGIRLAETGHALTRSPRLGTQEVSLNALLPNPPHGEKVRTLSTFVRLADGKVHFTRPQVWVRRGNLSDSKMVTYVDSGVWQDQDVDEPRLNQTGRVHSHDMVQRKLLPVSFIPEYHYNFDEGSGWYVSDAGTYSNRGWGWRTAAGTRKVPWKPPVPRDPQWEFENTVSGSAMRFLPSSRLGLRSNSGFSGAFTWAGWINCDNFRNGAKIFSDTNGLEISLNKDGRVLVTRNPNKTSVQVTSQTGLTIDNWHHIAVTYDLKNLRIFIDGKLSAEAEAPAVLARTQSHPWFGASSPEDKDGFSGILDEVIISSRAYDLDEIEEMARR